MTGDSRLILVLMPPSRRGPPERSADMTAATGSLLQSLPDRLAEERVEVLAAGGSTRIERIVSTGQASPPGFWYDQDQAEWVAVLTGWARLRFADEAEAIALDAADEDAAVAALLEREVQDGTYHHPVVEDVLGYVRYIRDH